MRNAASKAASCTCTVSRCCKSPGPAYQGVRSLREVTLSPNTADTGMQVIDLELDLRREFAIVALDLLERLLRVAHQVHLVDRQHDVADPEQRHEIAVTPGLGEHALAGIDQDHGEIGGRRAGDHVARVLLVPGGVGDDEFALLGGEKAIGDIDGDALFALGRQPIDQQREIDLPAARADCLANPLASAAN